MIIIYKTTCLINNKIYIGQHKIRYPSNFTLTFCDTHSTTPYGENIGNGELLTI